MPPQSTARVRLLDAMIAAIWERSYGSTTVDAICERADVRKGSFYHFFKSKTDLAVAALEHLWESSSRPTIEEVFSPSRPPLARFERMIELWYQKAINCQRDHGRVLGCPYFNLGTETAAIEPEVAATIRQMLDRYQSYVEDTLREAIEKGDISIDDPEETAACIFSMMEGCSTQARIHNDPERVRHFAGAFGRIIGAELHPNLESPSVRS
ncbi:TetR/AcrR family transcriptional regulator [Haloferula chungangensis]|uniref:TetR/AcrR family transcriptional regulator n=1 Tax=Haloferula chungangensis TaxID=1048331 RepID=A0ABW2L9W8_9BACT